MTDEWFGAELHKTGSGHYDVMWAGKKVGHIGGQPWTATDTRGSIITEREQRRADAVFALLVSQDLKSHRYRDWFGQKCYWCGKAQEKGKHL